MKIKIHNYTWLVEFVPADTEKMNSEPGKYNAGLTDHLEQVISIRKGMSPERTRGTVIHELIHAFLDSFGYVQDCLNEEEVCEFFGAQADSIMHLADQIMSEVRRDADNGRN